MKPKKKQIKKVKVIKGFAYFDPVDQWWFMKPKYRKMVKLMGFKLYRAEVHIEM